MTPRDIEKLKAIGFTVIHEPHTHPSNQNYYQLKPAQGQPDGLHLVWVPTEELGWEAHKRYVTSPDGMKATMADKIRFIGDMEICQGLSGWTAFKGRGPDTESGEGDSTEAAVDALFWKVRV